MCDIVGLLLKDKAPEPELGALLCGPSDALKGAFGVSASAPVTQTKR